MRRILVQEILSILFVLELEYVSVRHASLSTDRSVVIQTKFRPSVDCSPTYSMVLGAVVDASLAGRDIRLVSLGMDTRILQRDHLFRKLSRDISTFHHVCERELTFWIVAGLVFGLNFNNRM